MIENAWRHVLALTVTLLFLAGCATTTPDRVSEGGPGGTGTFPQPPQIADNVTFWTNVYGKWSREQVIIHDDKYLAVIYEVVRMPGAADQGYARDQRAFVEARKAYYQQRLANLQNMVGTNPSLSRDDQALLDKLVAAGGPGAIIGASDRVRVQRGFREGFRRGLEVSGRYDAAFREVMRKNGVPEDLAYLPHVESSFQVNARSAVGAAGVWQFMPATGRKYMTVTPAVDERLDPIVAADAAARYLRNAHSRLGSWPLAITSYNHGVGGMENAKANFGDDFGTIASNYKGSAFGFSSRNFYASFLAAREVAGNPQKYFPEGVNFAAPISADRLVLRHTLPASQVAEHYGLSVERLSELNLAWREPARYGKAPLPAGTTVWLPQGSLQRVASQPEPRPYMLAQAPSKPPTYTVAQTKSPPAIPAKAAAVAHAAPPAKVAAKPKPTELAKNTPPSKVVVAAKSGPGAKPAPAAKASVVKHHVVKPNETLYRVAMQYELSVDELRRLNGMAPSVNTIRAGQRLRVSG